jgi:DNA transformation protein and related proteins
MFGKTGVFCDGLMLGMVRDNTLYFRVDDDNRAAFKEAESFPPLNYEKKGGTIDLSFWRAPERLFDEPDELVTWARAALAAAQRVAAKRGRTAPRRKSKPHHEGEIVPRQTSSATCIGRCKARAAIGREAHISPRVAWLRFMSRRP